MPTYTFKNNVTNNIFDSRMSISDMETYLIDNPELEILITTGTPIGDSVRLGIKKPDDGFREVLSKIAERTAKSNLTDKLSRK